MARFWNWDFHPGLSDQKGVGLKKMFQQISIICLCCYRYWEYNINQMGVTERPFVSWVDAYYPLSTWNVSHSVLSFFTFMISLWSLLVLYLRYCYASITQSLDEESPPNWRWKSIKGRGFFTLHSYVLGNCSCVWWEIFLPPYLSLKPI